MSRGSKMTNVVTCPTKRQFHQTFLSILLRIKVICAAFLCLKFKLMLLWRKIIGRKSGLKMLVKLTPAILLHNAACVFGVSVCKCVCLRVSVCLEINCVFYLDWIVTSEYQPPSSFTDHLLLLLLLQIVVVVVCFPCVNFTNILCTAFSYESFAQSFFVLTFLFGTIFNARILA